ncbi:MAG: glycosyltransferase family 39 protein [Verrucomicrobiaceae bacterium]|nr:glycosyltransferase family 39 protein [Verrucomicrobiaceae bacterium]
MILLIGHVMEAEMSLKATFESWGVDRWWRLAWVLVATVVFAQVVQQHFGLGLTVRLEVEAKKIALDDGVYEWRIQHRYRNPLMEHRVVLFENGVPLQHAEKASAISYLRDGWYNHFRDVVKFVPKDGSDPRTNGKKYTLLAPKQWEGAEWMVPFLVLLALSIRLRKGRGGKVALPAFVERHDAAVVFSVALVVAFLRVVGAGLYSDGTFCVGGQPESDSAGWYNMAYGLAEGWGITTGFDGQRPFYSVMMAPLFLLPGDPMDWVRAMNAALWALGALSAYALGRALGGRVLGVCGALAVMMGETHLPHVMGVLTESPGMGLCALGTLAAWRALKTANTWLMVVAGALYGFANMTSGTTLLGVPMLAIYFLVVTWMRNGWVRSIWIAGAFTVGMSAVFLPWLIRQKVVLGVMTPSTNSGTLLRGGADPVHKRMWPGMNDEPILHGGVKRGDYAGEYLYHMNLFKKTVAEDPVRYIKQVSAAWVESFTYMRINDPAVRLAGISMLGCLGLAAAWRRGDIAGLLVAAGLIVGWMALSRDIVMWLFFVALGVLIWRWRSSERLWLLLLLALNLGSATVLAGMSGNQTASRLWQSIDWALVLISLAAFRELWLLLDGWIVKLMKSENAPSTEEQEVVGVDRWTTSTMWVCTAMAVFCVLATIIGPRHKPLAPLTPGAGAELLQKVKSEHPDDSIRAAADNLQVSYLKMTHRRYLQPVGYDTGHWLRHYGRMPVERWQFVAERADSKESPDGRSAGYMQARGDIGSVRPGQGFLAVSLKQDYKSRISGEPYPVQATVAVVPVLDGKPDWQELKWMEKLPMAY